jgi:uncharacterized membrane protein SirB2
MKQVRALLIQLFGALVLMVPIYQTWNHSPLEDWMSDGEPGGHLMEAWYLVLVGLGCIGGWWYIVGTITVLSYLLGLVGMRVLMVWWRRRLAKPVPAWDPTAGVARWAAIAVVSVLVYVTIANVMLHDARMAQFVFWLRAPDNLGLPVPGGFGCLSHSHWIFYAIYVVSVLIAWWLIRWIEKHWASRRPASIAP